MQENIEKKIDEILEEIKQIKSILQVKQVTKSAEVMATREIIRKLSVREFLNSIKISGDVERTLAIGYFLEKHKNLNSFNKRDLEDTYAEAKESRPKNINDKVNLNIKSGHMMEAGEKKDSIKAWTLTSTGEQVILQMLGNQDN